jgi:hypothetical protein
MRALLLLTVVACTDPAEPPSTEPIGACNGMLTTEHATSASHVEPGSQISWTNNPPTGGTHFGVWGAWDRQYGDLPRGYWVHNLEHGGIVLAYHCTDACPEVVDSLVAAAKAMAPDPMCEGAVKKRVIITGDALLPDGVQVAAVAWNHAYTASCYDPYVETFAAEHYAKAPENFCSDGINLGGTLIEP